MRLLFLVVAVALMSAACSPLRVHCDTRLRPINIGPSASDAVGSGEAPNAKSSPPGGGNPSGAKP